MVREAAQELAGQFAVVQVNTEESPGLASRFDVRGIPVIFLLKDGKVVDRVSGAMEKEALISWCRSHARGRG